MSEPNKITRRELLRGLVSGGASERMLAESELAAASVEGKTADGIKRRWGMAIDLDLCNGCGACVVACKSENNIPMQGQAPESEGCGIEWMSLLPRMGQEGDKEGEPIELLPSPCFHCENPPCVKVCPVNATYQNDEGLVAQIWDRCIGCRYCTVACPYSARSFNWKHAEVPDSYRNMLNPDVATRPEGVVEKCTFCYHRIRKVKETARIEEREIEPVELENLPACGQSCPAGAIVFGDLNDPESRVSRMARSSRAWRQQEHLGTQPKVYYLSRSRKEL